MNWLMGLALVLTLAGVGLTAWGRRGRGEAREALVLRRVDAYIETIRRERANPALAVMSDTELRDLLHASARNLRAAEERRSWMLLGGAGATLFASIVAAMQEGPWGLAVALGIGGLVLYGLNQYLVRKAHEPLARHGIEPDRITIE